MTTNQEFLTALFGEDAPWCHVSGFHYDPSNIPKGRELISWKGDYNSRYNLQSGTNQYFTISTFYCDDQQQARRRKALFRHTHVIVLDDVKEKLSMSEVSKLPSPSWILETSQGSEQWGYILDKPCENRSRVENLLDDLVANGLAPEGKDPGMKGVTRYVRLPEGSNNKSSKLVHGQPFKCNLTLWEPFNRVTIEQLAEPFCVDLDRPRRESRLDGASSVSDHPLINIPEIIHIKEVRSDGRFDITCPWVQEHTGADDSGSAIFTNADGSLGFKCHHGACQSRTGRDLVRHIDNESPGFASQLKTWQVMREFTKVNEPSFMSSVVTTVNFLKPISTKNSAQIQQPTVNTGVDAIELLCSELRRKHPTSVEARETAGKLLKFTDDLPKIDQNHWHTVVCDIMSWGKGEFKDIIKDLRKHWYGDKVSSATFYDDLVFVKEQNQFYEWRTRIFYSAEAFQNAFSHEDVEARKTALQEGRVKKVDKLDYAPGHPKMFTENSITYANTWVNLDKKCCEITGDITRWQQHFDVMGWSSHMKHIMQWMAFTLRHPERKINHMLLFGSGEGCGKDWLLYPLVKAMGENYAVISGEELLRDFEDHLLTTKYMHINEAELGDRREAMAVSNKLKPLAAAPPDTLRVNQKGVKPVRIRNILNASMTTNSQMPLRLNGPSRRFYAIWSDFNPRDEDDNMRQVWLDYWEDRWQWMKDYGWKHISHHLMHVVDLSDFNPAAAPPMTEFLRDIREASKSPMQQTIEAFIRHRHGAFDCDLVTASDMSDTLKSGGVFAPGDMYSDGRYFSPVKTGMVMKEIGRFMQIRTYHLSSPVRLWVLRDKEKYSRMEPADIYNEYVQQMTNARGKLALQAVK